TAQWHSRHLSQDLSPLAEYVVLEAGVPRHKRTGEERLMLRNARRRHGWRVGLFTIVACLLGLAIWKNLADQERRSAESLVDGVKMAAPLELPVAIEKLKTERKAVLPPLRRAFQETPADSIQRLHVACALAAFGEVESEYLVSRVATAPASEAKNLLAAM